MWLSKKISFLHVQGEENLAAQAHIHQSYGFTKHNHLHEVYPHLSIMNSDARKSIQQLSTMSVSAQDNQSWVRIALQQDILAVAQRHRSLRLEPQGSACQQQDSENGISLTGT